MKKFLNSLLVSLMLSQGAMAAPDFESDGPAPGNMRFAWIHGSISAKANTDVRIQVHQYNSHTFILRQNPAIHWEAPFMYLLFGSEGAVLLDTGATMEAEYFPIRATVDAVMSRWQQVNGVDSLPLTVVPLGSDMSQTEGLGQFADRPDTSILQPTDAARSELFASSTETTLDLGGGRELTLIATPGVDAAAITIYDPYTDFLFTGNSFYAGRLVIRDFAAYKDSLERLLDFADTNPVLWAMGGRIEMSDYPGLDYRLRSNYRPREHALQLPASLLQDCYNIVRLINGDKDIRIHDDFIVMNGVGRGARDYGGPVYTPARFANASLR